MRWRLCAFLVIFTCVVGVSSDWRFKREEHVVEERWITEFANNCSCVRHYECDNDGFIITGGTSLNLRTTTSTTPVNRIKCSGGKFDGDFVCCKPKPEETSNPKMPEIPATTTPEYITSTPSPIDSTTKRRKSIKCGRARPQLDVRIYSGDELNPLQSEFPWLAAIYRKRGGKKWQYQKLGSLIHPKVVLTATHVVGRVRSDKFKVIVNGEIELSAIGDNEEQERNVKEVVRHQNFSSGALYNDIALLILEEPYNISTTNNINTICLRPEMPFENKRCYVAGWGNTPNGNASSILKKVEVPVLSRETCQELLKKARYGDYYTFHESFICAGGEEGKGTCNGDGGSPLICPSGIRDSMYQVGILAYGLECGKKDVPDVYADVTYFHEWIVEELKNRHIEI